MRYAEVLPHKHDISKVAECRKENSEAVNARYKNIKKIMGKDIKARDALSSLYTSWMQSMLSVVPKGIVYPSEYERKADINLRRIQELGDKLIVTYCKQNMECASAINDNTKY